MAEGHFINDSLAPDVFGYCLVVSDQWVYDRFHLLTRTQYRNYSGAILGFFTSQGQHMPIIMKFGRAWGLQSLTP